MSIVCEIDVAYGRKRFTIRSRACCCASSKALALLTIQLVYTQYPIDSHYTSSVSKIKLDNLSTCIILEFILFRIQKFPLLYTYTHYYKSCCY